MTTSPTTKFLGKYTSIPSIESGPTVENGDILLTQDKSSSNFRVWSVHMPTKINNQKVESTPNDQLMNG